MDTLFKIELNVEEIEREESFPFQEQTGGPVQPTGEIPASIVFAERGPVTGSDIAAPVFIP